MNAMQLGHIFYLVEVVGDLSSTGTITLWADDAQTNLDGSLAFTNHIPGGAQHFTGLLIPPGCWKVVSAVHPVTHAPIVADTWIKEQSEE
jgi:hypothetical protein